MFHLCEVVSENPGLEIPSPGISGIFNTENFYFKVLGVVGLSTSDFRSLDLSVLTPKASERANKILKKLVLTD